MLASQTHGTLEDKIRENRILNTEGQLFPKKFSLNI